MHSELKSLFPGITDERYRQILDFVAEAHYREFERGQATEEQLMSTLAILKLSFEGCNTSEERELVCFMVAGFAQSMIPLPSTKELKNRLYPMLIPIYTKLGMI